MSNRFSVNEKEAIARLKQFCASQIDYGSNDPAYLEDKSDVLEGPWNEQLSYQHVDQDVRYGYYFSYKVSESKIHGRILSWSGTAWPVEYPTTGLYSFYIDEEGLIRGADIGGDKGERNLPIIKSQN